MSRLGERCSSRILEFQPEKQIWCMSRDLLPGRHHLSLSSVSFQQGVTSWPLSTLNSGCHLYALPLPCSSLWIPPSFSSLSLPVGVIYTLFLCLAPPRGCHVQVLLHHGLSTVISQMGAFTSLVLISGVPGFRVATQRPGWLVILGPMIVEQSERQFLADCSSQSTAQREKKQTLCLSVKGVYLLVQEHWYGGSLLVWHMYSPMVALSGKEVVEWNLSKLLLPYSRSLVYPERKGYPFLWHPSYCLWLEDICISPGS